MLFAGVLALLPIARRHILATAFVIAAMSVAGYAVVLFLVV